MATAFAFPFFGAGDAEYFEFVNVLVVLTRNPTKSERAEIVAGAPAVLQAGVKFVKHRITVFAGEEGGGFIRKHGSERINRALETWLKRCHKQVPILAVFRPEDLEASGTVFSAWHDWSLEQLGAIERKLGGIHAPIGDTDLVEAITAQAEASRRRQRAKKPTPRKKVVAKAGRTAKKPVVDNATVMAAARAQDRSAALKKGQKVRLVDGIKVGHLNRSSKRRPIRGVIKWVGTGKLTGAPRYGVQIERMGSHWEFFDGHLVMPID